MACNLRCNHSLLPVAGSTESLRTHGGREESCLHVFGARCHWHFTRSVDVVSVGSLIVLVVTFARRTDRHHAGNEADDSGSPSDEQRFSEDVSVQFNNKEMLWICI